MAHICPHATRVAQNKAFHFSGFIGLFLKTITSIVRSNNLKEGPFCLPGLEIATDMVAKATNIFSLATKNSGLVATLATIFLDDLDLN